MKKVIEQAVGPRGCYKRLTGAIEALGGTLKHHKMKQPQGGSWILKLGVNSLVMPSTQAQRYPDLDECFQLKPGVVSYRTWKDCSNNIDPKGVARLFERLSKAVA